MVIAPYTNFLFEAYPTRLVIVDTNTTMVGCSHDDGLPCNMCTLDVDAPETGVSILDEGHYLVERRTYRGAFTLSVTRDSLQYQAVRGGKPLVFRKWNLFPDLRRRGAAVSRSVYSDL